MNKPTGVLLALIPVFCVAAYAAGSASDDAGFLMITDIDVHDEATYARYREQVKPIIEKHGGRYLVRAGAMFVSDDPSSKIHFSLGDWNPDRIIVLHFDSMEELQSMFSSPEYEAIVDLRLSSSDSRAVVVMALE